MNEIDLCDYIAADYTSRLNATATFSNWGSPTSSQCTFPYRKSSRESHETDKIPLSDTLSSCLLRKLTKSLCFSFRVNIFEGIEGILDYSSSQVDNQHVTIVASQTARKLIDHMCAHFMRCYGLLDEFDNEIQRDSDFRGT